MLRNPIWPHLDSLIAKQDITELVYLYMRGLDRWDGDLMRSLFHDDAWCEYGFMNGSAREFIDYCMAALASHAANHHFVGNILIEVEGDEAFGEVYFNAYHKIGGENGFDDVIIAGRYLIATSGAGWKFAYRSERVDWSHTARATTRTSPARAERTGWWSPRRRGLRRAARYHRGR